MYHRWAPNLLTSYLDASGWKVGFPDPIIFWMAFFTFVSVLFKRGALIFSSDVWAKIHPLPALMSHPLHYQTLTSLIWTVWSQWLQWMLCFSTLKQPPIKNIYFNDQKFTHKYSHGRTFHQWGIIFPGKWELNLIFSLHKIVYSF